MARSFLCKVECQQSRSCELVPGQSGIPAGPFGDGICDTGGRRRESVWGASSAGTAIPDRGPIHQPAGRPRHKDRRLHHRDCRNTVALPSTLSCSAFCIPGVLLRVLNRGYLSGQVTGLCLSGWPPCSQTGVHWAWRESSPLCCTTLYWDTTSSFQMQWVIQQATGHFSHFY